ncbi:MAG: Hpt domain-containing protein [Proteobacteria bacterium]|nr:Hpt domain-containing protein [Pseudomonadota bacterium]MBK8961168.1 Hpt domain-containing protein [Pseudomonadota bacterium]
MTERIPVVIDPDLADLVPGFLNNRRRDVEKLQVLLEAGNFADIRMIGHSMKGAGGGYGFDPITDIGAAIERAALAGDGTAITAGIAQLADYLARIDVVSGA